MGSDWSFSTPDGKTVVALILPDLTASESFVIAEKVKERIAVGAGAGRQVAGWF